jgi:uncharacterized protein YuzE
MRLTYDDQAGAAYLRLRHETDEVGRVSSITFRPPDAVAADDYFTLDFDESGRLVGIEFLSPDNRLVPSVLAAPNAPDHGTRFTFATVAVANVRRAQCGERQPGHDCHRLCARISARRAR